MLLETVFGVTIFQAVSPCPELILQQSSCTLKFSVLILALVCGFPVCRSNADRHVHTTGGQVNDHMETQMENSV